MKSTIIMKTCIAAISTSFLVFLLLGLLLLGGCYGTGLSKKATWMPDRVGISIGQQRFKSEDSAWRGITINAQWDLK